MTEAETGAPVAGAAVEALASAGPVASNAEGRFSLTVAAGTHSVVVTVIGYETTRVDGVRVEAQGDCET